MKVDHIILPHNSSKLYLTDGGLETTLVFLEGIDLPYFAAFDILKEESGYLMLKNYYRRYLNIARDYNAGFILETPTWRANPYWIVKIGYGQSALDQLNTKAVQLVLELKNEFEKQVEPIIISGCVGPRGDGYVVENAMSADEAQRYHSSQIEVFGKAQVDVISAITMNYVEEAIGITRAAHTVGLPVVISFTVETDGKLPTGMTLKDAIAIVDQSVEVLPIYYMINCAHPTHFKSELINGKNETWTNRIRGIRANASCKSHAELDEATDLDRGNPIELGGEYKMLKQIFGQLNVFGGCCGTDDEHVLEIANRLKYA